MIMTTTSKDSMTLEKMRILIVRAKITIRADIVTQKNIWTTLKMNRKKVSK